MTLVLPNLQGKQMGQVLTTITVTNRIDQVLAERGFIPAGEIRSFTLDRVLVDTGATLLALPAPIISQLGLSQLGETNVETAAGIRKGRIFQDIMLEVEGRQAVFDCLEMPEGVDAVLLGVIPMERLGLEPDLKNQRLRVLPMNDQQTYLMV
ncbi:MULTISPECIES: retroviral-like aspartic protease family protein [unclassified Microcoleus]|uniref:retroviral-like aspartic protease family protein n=1 Tax=unclassified Microcoleus TaxID=2642155 RepID=UPI002FD1ED74